VTLEKQPSNESVAFIDRCPNCGMPITGDGPCPRCGLAVSVYRSAQQTPLAAPKLAVPASPTSGTRVALNVLALLLGVYWLYAGVRRGVSAVANAPGQELLLLFVVAVLSLIVGAYGVYVSWCMYRRVYRVQGQLVLSSVLCTFWGLFVPALLGGWLQVLVVPLHVLLGVLAVTASRYFDSDRRDDD
jgi:hypothetical protein